MEKEIEIEENLSSSSPSFSSSSFVSPYLAGNNRHLFRSKMCYRKEIFDGNPITSVKSYCFLTNCSHQRNNNNKGAKEIKETKETKKINEEGYQVYSHRILAAAGTSIYLLDFNIDSYLRYVLLYILFYILYSICNILYLLSILITIIIKIIIMIMITKTTITILLQ